MTDQEREYVARLIELQAISGHGIDAIDVARQSIISGRGPSVDIILNIALSHLNSTINGIEILLKDIENN